MEMAWLEDFGALIRAGNFSRAASARCVTQPAFSRRIRALEEWLGVELVDRSTHQMALTPAGKRFAMIAETVLRDIEHGRREVQEIAGTSASTVKILVTHALALNFFPQWLAKLQAMTDTEIPIQLTADNMGASEQIMLNGKAHFCLCYFYPGAASVLDGAGFQSLSLGADALVPVSAPREKEQAPLHPLTDDAGRVGGAVHLLAYGAESGMGRIVSAMFEKNAIPVSFTPVFTSHTLVLARMAKDGKGLAWLPLSIIADDLATGSLVRAGDARWDIPVDVRLYRPRARQSQSAEAFWKLAAA
ncbi:DNA-binding transcriptional LysR family regulator [Sphingopyxis panaciterrae]|uniref:LysR family transcriptional regulator n=1 Tax=Sphingopyxis panaciterrae TaxID=363841 RepID=UPI00141E0890|nr:LysR family transcriptional regulator [Sphingopyxis panaciterrae]NIJ39416.1 DNA-binding transcriptional LysR family regulator [Sphingopyxis panaciterrae]